MASTAALDGLKVLDLTSSTFNYAGKLLAGFGADVVKVEPPGGDEIRRQPPFQHDEPNPELSGRHLHMNTGKRSIVLDVNNAADVQQLKQLLPEYDILIENFRPGYLSDRGLGYEDLKELNPDLIMASVTYFGQDGPYSSFAGSEIVANALGGYLYLTGEPDRPPVKSYDNLIEHQAALHAAVAILVAVTARETVGGGDHLDIAAVDAAMFLIGVQTQAYHWSRVVAKRAGTRLVFGSPDGPYPSCISPCLGGYVHAHTNVRNPDLLAVLMNEPELNDAEIMATPAAHADQIDEIMSRWLMKYDKFEVVRLAQELRIPFTEVLTPEEVVNDPHLRDRGFFVDVSHPVAGVVKQPGAPGLLTGTPWETRRAPLLGEHQDEVLGKATRAGDRAATERRPPVKTVNVRALNGVRVLEFAIAAAGPIACHILGDMGAEVLKVEEPRARALSPSNTTPPREGAPDRPYNRVTTFLEWNHSKQAVALNVSGPAGREVFLRIAAISDVMIENFSPRVMGNLGIDYEELKKVNPSIIVVSMPAFGKTGPYKDRGSYGPGIDAMSGISELTGYPEDPPGKPAYAYCDYNAGLHAAFAVMAALRHRRRTGEGQYIEMSMIEGELQAVAPALMDVTLNGRNRTRIGNRHDWYVPHGLYPCAGDDEWVAIAVTSDEQWDALCGALDRADLAADPRYRTRADRYDHQDELDPVIAAWTGTLPHYDVQARLQAVGVPAGAALKVNELYTDPQLTHRGSIAWTEHPEMGPFPHTRTAWLSERGDCGIAGPGPAFGGANDYVFRELLGMDAAGVQRLIDGQITAYVPIGFHRR